MNIAVRTAESSDVPFMLTLIKELALYERSPNEVIATEETMLRFGFGKEKIFDSLVAVAEGKIVGLAVYYTCYSTWKGKIIYLDDIIVTEEHRRSGIGKMLFDEVGRNARQSGANQLRWHVLDWNSPAIDFYKKYHASFEEDWITCKLSREQLEKLF